MVVTGTSLKHSSPLRGKNGSLGEGQLQPDTQAKNQTPGTKFTWSEAALYESPLYTPVSAIGGKRRKLT